jgi:hypothetical protein
MGTCNISADSLDKFFSARVVCDELKLIGQGFLVDGLLTQEMIRDGRVVLTQRHISFSPQAAQAREALYIADFRQAKELLQAGYRPVHGGFA